MKLQDTNLQDIKTQGMTYSTPRLDCFVRAQAGELKHRLEQS